MSNQIRIQYFSTKILNLLYLTKTLKLYIEAKITFSNQIFFHQKHKLLFLTEIKNCIFQSNLPKLDCSAKLRNFSSKLCKIMFLIN